MFKKILVSALLLSFLVGCGWLNLTLPASNPEPGVTQIATQGIPATALEPTATLRRPTRATLTPGQPAATANIPGAPELPAEAPAAVKVEIPRYIVQPGTPTWVANFLAPDAACSYQGIAGQVFDSAGMPVIGLIIEVTGELNGNPVLQLVLSGAATKLGPGGYEIRLADRAIASDGTLSIQVFDLAGNALSDQIFFDTLAGCDGNQILLNFTAVKIIYDKTIYFPFMVEQK